MAYQKLISIIRALDMELDTNNTEKAYPIGWSDWALFAIFENTALSCRSCLFEILEFGVLKQFGTTGRVPNFFLQKSLHPNFNLVRTTVRCIW